jgi:molecular chaperone GrpE (heat shock protein)
MHRLLHDLEQFEDYQTILASIRKDIKAGMKEAELARKYAPLAQARIISDMLTTDNPQAALAAAKDLLDRANGKATEKKEVTHKFSELKDEELDAILKSEVEELGDMGERFDQ